MLNFLPMIPLAYFGLKLSIIDLRTHRLPNQIVGQFAIVEFTALLATSWMTSDLLRFAKALGVATAIMAGYLLLYIFSRGAMGFGDVKFAFPLGLCVGWFAAEYWLMSLFATFLIAGLVSLFGLAVGRINRKSKLALGPYMFAGTLLTLVYGLGLLF